MSDRERRGPYRSRIELNRGDYRGDFGPEGYSRFEHRDDRRYDPNARHHAYGSGYDAWAAGEGFRPAGFGFGPEEGPGPGGIRDEDWQPNRPARGHGRWAGDWEYNEAPRDRASREDYRWRENHRGRGPKGYRRSDDRIREEVCERLTDDWYVDASEISVSVHDGEVTLAGVVPSREQKRRAEQSIEHLSGVCDVINQLRVPREGAMGYDDRSSSSLRERAGASETPSVAADRGKREV